MGAPEQQNKLEQALNTAPDKGSQQLNKFENTFSKVENRKLLLNKLNITTLASDKQSQIKTACLNEIESWNGKSPDPKTERGKVAVLYLYNILEGKNMLKKENIGTTFAETNKKITEIKNTSKGSKDNPIELSTVTVVGKKADPVDLASAPKGSKDNPIELSTVTVVGKKADPVDLASAPKGSKDNPIELSTVTVVGKKEAPIDLASTEVKSAVSESNINKSTEKKEGPKNLEDAKAIFEKAGYTVTPDGNTLRMKLPTGKSIMDIQDKNVTGIGTDAMESRNILKTNIINSLKPLVGSVDFGNSVEWKQNNKNEFIAVANNITIRMQSNV